MMRTSKKVVGHSMLIMLMLMGTSFLAGQDSAKQDNQENTDNSTHNVTGCLGKTSIANSDALTDEDGKPWDLRSETVPLCVRVCPNKPLPEFPVDYLCDRRHPN